MVGCDISGYSTSSSCSIATGEFAITSGLLSNPDGDDEESSIQVGGTDADLIYIENTSGNDWLITLRSNADISQKNQYQFSLTYSDNGINTRTDNITLTVTN